MIRTCLEFLLSRALDAGKPPAPWLQRWVQRDNRLGRFDSSARQLDTLLRSTAAEQRQALASGRDVAALTLPPQRRTVAGGNPRVSVRWLGGLAAAAILAVVLLPNWFRPTTPAVHAGEFSQQLTIVPGKVLRLITRAAESSQTHLPQLSPLANLSVPQLPAWEEVAFHFESPVQPDPLLQKYDAWQESWQNLKSRWPAPPQEL